MTEYLLNDAHPYYQRVIPVILEALQAKYPQASLKTVKLTDRKVGDHSLGNATDKGVIAFNPYWFCQKPTLLKRAAAEKTAMPIGDGKFIPFHGAMTEEPIHVVTHEFGHVLCDAYPDWMEWTFPRWLEATLQPQLAPAGYGLAGGPVEYWAELFAAMELGLTDSPHGRELATFLSTVD